MGLGFASLSFFLSAWAGTGFWWLKFLFAFIAITFWGRPALRAISEFRRAGYRLSLGPIQPLENTPPAKLAIIILLVSLTVFHLFFSAFNSVNVPSYFDDEKGNWNIRAKHVYEMGRLVTDDPSSPSFLDGGGGRKAYPLGFVMAKVYFAEFAGHWDESTINLITLVVWFLVVALVFQSFSSPFWGTLASYAIVSLPIASWQAGAAYFDLTVAAFFLLSLIGIRRYFAGDGQIWAMSAGFFLFWAICTKNEGIVLVFPALAVGILATWIIGKSSLKSAIRDVSLFALGASPAVAYLAYRAVYHLPLSPAGKNEFAFHVDSLGLYWTLFTDWGSYNVFWYALPLFVVFFWKKFLSKDMLPVTASLVALAGAIFATFSFTNNYQYLLDQTTINRTLLIFMVPATYFCVRVLSESNLFNHEK